MMMTAEEENSEIGSQSPQEGQPSQENPPLQEEQPAQDKPASPQDVPEICDEIIEKDMSRLGEDRIQKAPTVPPPPDRESEDAT